MWWYNNTKGNWTDFDDVAFAITSDVLSHLENHTVNDYYIYNELGLYKVIKGCELDPLSVYAHNWTKRQKIHANHCQLKEYGETFDEKWNHVSLIVYGEYERSEDEIAEIKRIEQNIEKRELRFQKRINDYGGEKLLNEYEIKMDFNIPVLNPVKVHLYEEEIYDFNKMKDFIKDKCQLLNNSEDCYYILGLSSEFDFMGLIKLHKLDNTVYKFLILLGCTRYIIIQNDYNGNDFRTEEDGKRYLEYWDSSRMLNLYLTKFYRITKNQDVDI